MGFLRLWRVFQEVTNTLTSFQKGHANFFRYYFGTLKLTLNQVKLSVSKSGQLPADLLAVKRKLGLSFITFEDASVELDPFVRVHPFETINFLTNAVVKHYQVKGMNIQLENLL